MYVGKGVYELIGQPEQQEILLPCFTEGDPSYIAFPWEKLSPPFKPIPIGWDDLNGSGGLAAIRWAGPGPSPNDPHLGVGAPGYGNQAAQRPEKIPGHVHVHDDEGNEGHGILRFGNGRWWIAGVFWTDGRIYIDNRCSPELAREVMAAELAHSVDYFLPLSDLQKASLMDLWHDHVDDLHTWWEIHDYGGEYYTLGGEAFMAAFTIAYSKMVPDQSAFTHKTDPSKARQIRETLGVPAVGEEAVYKVFRVGRGRRFHRETCWTLTFARLFHREIVAIDISSALVAGLTACRSCKPSA